MGFPPLLVKVCIYQRMNNLTLIQDDEDQGDEEGEEDDGQDGQDRVEDVVIKAFSVGVKIISFKSGFEVDPNHN